MLVHTAVHQLLTCLRLLTDAMTPMRRRTSAACGTPCQTLNTAMKEDKLPTCLFLLTDTVTPMRRRTMAACGTPCDCAHDILGGLAAPQV